MTIDQQVDDGEMLLDFAIERKLPITSADATVLRAARGKLPNLGTPGPDRDAFIQALNSISAVIPISNADLRSARLRCERLKPLVSNAMSLLSLLQGMPRKLTTKIAKR